MTRSDRSRKGIPRGRARSGAPANGGAHPTGHHVQRPPLSPSDFNSHSSRDAPRPHIQQSRMQRGYRPGDASYAPRAAGRPTAQELYPDHVRKRNRSRLSKRIGLSALAVLLVILLAGGGYALWYSNALNNALFMGSEQDASVNAALTAGEAGKPFYMLVLGSDSREGSGTSDKEAESGDNQRSDVMILLRVDPASRQVTMVSIPRDTPLMLEDGRVVKINEAYNLGGAAYSIRAVSDLTGVPISHYAEVHFSEFQELVDKLGGITVDVPVEISYQDALTGETVKLEPGVQTLDGQEAQIFARARHEYGDNQEAKRQSNIRQLFQAIVDEVLQKSLTELPGTVLDLASCVGTDMDTADIVSLALQFAGASGKVTMYSCTGPSNGDFFEEHDGMWLCYENPEGWATLMADVDAGEDPSSLDVESMAIVPQALDAAA